MSSYSSARVVLGKIIRLPPVSIAELCCSSNALPLATVVIASRMIFSFAIYSVGVGERSNPWLSPNVIACYLSAPSPMLSEMRNKF